MVIKRYEKLFERLEPPQPPVDLFDRIICAIEQEREFQKKKRLFFCFFSLLIISFISMPFSLKLFFEEIKSSGIHYFIFTALSDFNVFLLLWKEFSLAILESLPIVPIVVFTLNIAFLLFTFRLFFHRKRSLLAI